MSDFLAAIASCVISQTASVYPMSFMTKEKAFSAAVMVALATWETSAPAAIKPTTSFHAFDLGSSPSRT